MTPPRNNANTTHYDILQVDQKASYNTIKESFHLLARQHHPDRNTQTASSSSNNDNFFRQVQAAWECLRNDATRKAYDQELRLRESKNEAMKESAMELSLSDCRQEMILEEEGTMAIVYTCRCGQELDLEDDGTLLTACHGCSLVYNTKKVWEELEG